MTGGKFHDGFIVSVRWSSIVVTPSPVKVAYPDRPKLYPETMISDDDFKDRRDVQ